MSAGKKILAGTAVVLIVGVILTVAGALFVAPAVAQKLVRERLDRVEARLGLDVTTDAIETVGVGGVEIANLSIVDPSTQRTLVKVGKAGGKLSLTRLMTGDKIITDVWSHDVSVVITREADGQFDLLRLVKAARGGDEEAQKDPTSDGAGGGLLARFGGTLPEVDVTNVNVRFDAVEGVNPFPLKEFTVPVLEIVHEDGISVSTKVTVKSAENSEWILPSEVDVAAVLSEELKPKTLNVKFDRAVEVGGLEPVPYLRAGFDGVELSPEGLVMVTDAHLGFRTAKEPFAKTRQIAASVAQWALNPKDLVLANLTVESPSIHLTYDEQGASQLSDLDHAIRAPRARDVVASATRFAKKLEESQKKKEEPTDIEEEFEKEQEVAQAPEPKPSGPSRVEQLLTRLPQEIVVKNATVDARDHRTLPVVRRSRELRLENGALRIAHDMLAGSLTVEGGFDAKGDEQSRGSAKGLVSVNYRKKTVDADVTVDALDLSWLGQIMGPRVAENIRGGTLRAKLDVKPATGSAVTIDGNVSVENGVYFWDLLAEEPVTDFTASYGFTAKYDPAGTMPESRLLKKGLFKDSNRPADGDAVHKGSLVFSKGEAQLGAARATVTPAVYGTGALPGRMPKRVDLRVNIPKTPVQTLFDAVPVAIQGPLAGTEMAGNFGWNLEVEVPPYRAGDMEWVSSPVLEEFELVSIPAEVDPRNLMSGFRLTIETELEDKKGEKYDWSRTVRIPAAKPVSAKYLLDNAGLDIEDLDLRRREREWPPVPDPKKSWLPRTMLESPQYWLSQNAEAQIAPRPWQDTDTIERTEKAPYGPYVFVPLHHISKWVVRTVTTTEDGGFFRHPGFLFDSLKESVEDNIEASRFRRGGSTISMQLVKNAFLDQKKLLARKMREAFIVWLMESVIDVPKSRILEVYLNIIEFGPGIYGIHDASVHYFGKRPDELTVAEVAWLFSILPAPKRYHFYWDKGEISKQWFAKMKRYLDAMVRRDKLSEEERDAAAAEPPVFYKPDLEALEPEPVLKPKDVAEGGLFGIPLLGGEQGSTDGTAPAPTPSNGQTIPSPNTPNRIANPPEKKKKKWFWNR